MAGIDPISIGLSIGEKIVDHFFPDPQKKAEAMLELQKLEQSGDLAIVGYQSAINTAEASNPSMFVAGWRPFIGWLCGIGLGFQMIFAPLASWIVALAGHPTQFPALDTSTLSTLLIGMLGLGGMRTLEKMNSVQGNH